MKSESIDGKTGKVSFNNEGDRLNPIYWIKNVQQQGIVEVGFHGNKKGDSGLLKFGDTQIVWPGGFIDKPKGLKISTHLQVCQKSRYQGGVQVIVSLLIQGNVGCGYSLDAPC